LGSADAEATGSYTFTLNAAGISVVEGWVNGTTPNYGMLFMNDAGALDGVDFSSKENATSDNRPTLIIEYATTPSATFAANEDTKLTGATVGTNYRLRFEIANNNPSEVTNSYQLQVAQDTVCSSGTYASVPTDTSGHWQIGTSTYIEDGLHTANISPGLTDSLTTFVPGYQKDTGNITNDITLSTDEFTEIEFSVKATTNAASNTNYCFRLTNVDTYTIYAELETGTTNNAPNSPTSLAQKTSGDVTIATGGWHNITSIKFTATATDTDNPDTLYLCIEKDLLGTGFSNTEDSCGTGVSYTGSGVSVTHTISGLTDASEYHWQARVKDTAGTYSSWVSYDVNAESARDFGIDSTSPTGGTIYDGTGVGVDVTYNDGSLSSLSANWSGFTSGVSGLASYDYSIGTTSGATDIKAWTSNSTSTTVTSTGLTLHTGQLYFVNVRANDNAGNNSIVSSNGQLVAPTLSFAISPATLTFANLNPGNSYGNTQTTTLTTSTNAYNGYVIRSFVSDYLRSTDAGSTIVDFDGGTYASPATWGGGNTGFGYTSSDTTIQGANKFATASLYAPFSHTGPGDIVADHTALSSGTPITNEQFDITYQVKTLNTQPAKKYSTSVIYTATAQY
jgi:hypothetical protein